MLQNQDKRNRMRVKHTMQTPVGVTSWSVGGIGEEELLTIEFDQPVLLNGTPQYEVDVSGASVVSAMLTSPTTLVVTFDRDITTATIVTVPYQDKAVRNRVGGYVTPKSIAA